LINVIHLFNAYVSQDRINKLNRLIESSTVYDSEHYSIFPITNF